MSTEVAAPKVSDELHFPTVHPEVCKVEHQPEALWNRRRVLIRDILLSGFAFFLAVTNRGQGPFFRRKDCHRGWMDPHHA